MKVEMNEANGDSWRGGTLSSCPLMVPSVGGYCGVAEPGLSPEKAPGSSLALPTAVGSAQPGNGLAGGTSGATGGASQALNNFNLAPRTMMSVSCMADCGTVALKIF